MAKTSNRRMKSGLDAKPRRGRRSLAVTALLLISAALSLLAPVVDDAAAAFGSDHRESLRLPLSSSRLKPKAIPYPGGETLLFIKSRSGERGLLRLRSNGSRDRSFGDNGYLKAPFEATADVAVQPDGRIVFTGTRPSPGSASELVVGRLLADGRVDRTFGQDGISTLGQEGWRYGGAAVDVGADGRIIVGGTQSPVPTPPSPPSYISHGGPAFSIVDMFLADGSLDGSFSAGIRAESMSDVVALRGGATLVLAEGRLFRLRRSGATDKAFGSSGALPIAPGSYAIEGDEIKVGSQGEIIVRLALRTSIAFALARYRADGHLDTSFGRAGVVRSPVEDFPTSSAIAVGPAGKIFAAGQGAIFAWNSEGRPDRSFGRRGRLPFRLPGGRRAGVSDLLVRDGHLWVVGSTWTGGVHRLAVAKLPLSTAR